MKITRLATWRAKPISWVTHSMVMPSSASCDHGVEHLLDHLRIERRGRLVEQHDLRVHAQRAGDRDALLLAAGQLARIFAGLLGDLDALEIVHRDLLGVALLGILRTQIGASVQVLQHGQVREQVEVLEHHADLAADLVDLLEVVGELDAVDDDAALLVLLQAVDAADHGRFAGAGRPADDDALAARDAQVDVAQHVEFAVPLVHADDLDRDVGLQRRGLQGCGYRLGHGSHHPSAPVAGGEPGFDEARVARHAVAEDQIEHRGEGIAGGAGDRRRPFRIDARRPRWSSGNRRCRR